MSIRQQICWSEVDHRYIGYCDYGNDFNIERNEIEAKEVGFHDGKFKRKVEVTNSIFFKTWNAINNFSGNLAELIKTALILTSKIKSKINNL